MKIYTLLFRFILFLLLSFSATNSNSQQIAINEIMSSNSSAFSDVDGDFEDWIEIYNYGNTSINLSGFGLSDEIDNKFKWVFPSVTIAAKSYLVVWASDKNRTISGQQLHTNFKIKSGGEAIILTNSSGTKIDESSAVAIATDKSYGRKPDGTGSWIFFDEGTPNASNSGTSSGDPEKIAINEFMTSNDSVTADEDGDYEDWLEFYNYGSTTINLSGFGLSDEKDLPYKWVFPSITLAPDQYVLVWASDKNRAIAGQQLHTNFKLSQSGETIYLTNKDGLLISGSPSVALNVDVSYGRKPNGTGSWLFFDTPTPSASNDNSGSTKLLEPPSFSHSAGLYSSSFNLELTTDIQNATIIYTLDGSEPDINNLTGSIFNFKNNYPLLPGDPFGNMLTENYTSKTYTGPINISEISNQSNQLTAKNSNQFEQHIPPLPVRKATVIRAKVYLDGKGSQTASKTFFVWNDGNPYNFPVVSIQIPEKLLFDYDDGIYTSGIDFDKWRISNPNNNQSWRPNINNYWRSGRDWEYPANIELFSATSMKPVQNLKGGLRIHGNNSRIGIVKNLRLYARSEYDTKNEYEHNFFKQVIPEAIKPYNNQYKRLFLRGDGAGGSIAYDVAFSRAMQPIYNGVTRIEPAIHFFNGEYWGITAFRDRLDKYHYDFNFDVNSDNFIQISCNGSQCELDEGENSDYETYLDMRDFIIDNDMSSLSKYIQASTLLDMTSFIDHVIMVIYASNNSYERKYWKARTKENDKYGDGKWRMSVQDFEASLSNQNWLEYLSDTGRSDNNAVFANLLENENFKQRFLNRFSDILNTVYSSEHFASVINDTFNEITPYLSEDANRADRDDFYETEEKTDLLNWANNRPQEQRTIILNQFNISKTIDLDLDVSYYNGGFVKVNTIDIKSSTPGVSENPYPWSGVYFDNIPITLEAKPLPGYSFSHWSGDASGNDKTITITPTSDLQIKANFTADSDFSHLIYFWLFDDNIENDTPLESVKATYSRNNLDGFLNYQSSLNGYPFSQSSVNWRRASIERKNDPTSVNYIPFANNDIAYSSEIVKGLQIKQPFKDGSLENTIELNFSTANFKDIKLSFAMKSDGAAHTLIVDYWNGSGWVSSNITSSLAITDTYEKKEVDFTNVSLANNNSEFKIRLRFRGLDMTSENGKTVSINNISVQGIETALSTDNFIAKNNLNIYPNPTTGRLHVKSTQEIDKVFIYNMLGQLMYSENTKKLTTNIDLQNFDKGVYLLRVLSDKKSITKRIIKN